MEKIIIDKKFRQIFKEVCLNNSEKFVEELSSVFNLPEFHFSHCVLNRYFRKAFGLQFDKSIANKILKNYFENAGFSIINYEEPYLGGYPNSLVKKTINPDELITDLAILKRIDSDWDNFIVKIKHNYWDNKSNITRFLSIDNFKFYENRPPKSPREKFLSSPQEIEIEGKIIKVKYNFFNIDDVLIYYDNLIAMFYPDFSIMKNISNKKIKRFGKQISADMFIGIYFDYSFLEKELKHTYLELPNIRVEVFSGELNNFIKEELYLKDQQAFPIARINLHYFMGQPTWNRIGNSSENEKDLKKNLFFYFEVYSFYLNKYISSIEENLKATLLN